MPDIDPALVPCLEPGNIFSRFTTDDSLDIRWLTASDPVFFQALNRPDADIAFRQLILAKSLDQINLRLSHQSFFPFYIQPTLKNNAILPLSWIWDLHASLPRKWQNVRLAKLVRIDGDLTGGAGTGGTGSDFTGTVRLIFSAVASGSSTETSIFKADYLIDSALTYQRLEILPIDASDGEAVYIAPSEASTISGNITFRTLDVDDSDVREFYDLIPPSGTGDPIVYEVADSTVGIIDVTATSHGQGMLVDSAYNAIPDLASNIDSWVQSFNYPFRVSANRQSLTTVSTGTVDIPLGLFHEFNVTVPAGDEPSGDTSGEFRPVWINRISRGTSLTDDPLANTITIWFATHTLDSSAYSTQPVEFAYLELPKASSAGDVIGIIPTGNLQNVDPHDPLFEQEFGRGHVVLSSKWPSDEINDFFLLFTLLTASSNEVIYTKPSTIMSSYSLSRIPEFSPTRGQSIALLGSSSDFDTPIHPSSDNKYVTEKDEGLGNPVDLTDPELGFTAYDGIDDNAYSGSKVCRKFVLIIDHTKDQDYDYDADILPRIRHLLGRDPVFGDTWFDGQRFKQYDELSNNWVG
jgi:hypothetical protein